VKQLKELHQQIDIKLSGDIATVLDNPREWAEQISEDEIVKAMPVYSKAKNLGENFAREIDDNKNI